MLTEKFFTILGASIANALYIGCEVMKFCTVSFFGHRHIEGDIWELDEKLREVVQLMINRNYCTECLVGTGGDFARIVSSAIRYEQKRYDEV